MIRLIRHEYNEDLTAYAQFSADNEMRYHLIRCLSEPAKQQRLEGIGAHLIPPPPENPDHSWLTIGHLSIAVFVMLNPSIAGAIKDDRTQVTCCTFAQRWGCDIAWLVNLHAFISTYPTELGKRAIGFRGDDADNDHAIRFACRSAATIPGGVVIAGWGAYNKMDGRDMKIRSMIEGITPLYHLGMTKDGFPKHPQARGKHRILAEQKPIPWTAP
jgi:hypothetical protein